MPFSPAVTQLLIAGSTMLAAFSVGGVIGYPGVLLQQLRRNDTTIPLDLDTASWIGSMQGLSGIPCILMPAIMQWRGRKFAFILACSFVIVGWMCSYAASSVLTILISEFFHGLGTNSIFSVSLLTMGEMVTPKYRMTSLLFYNIIQSLGIALVGIMGRFLHRKTISIVMCVPTLVAFIIAFTWPHSPSWLACKGKFEKCERTFKLLRGTDNESKKELEELVTAQKEIFLSRRSKNQRLSLKTFWGTVTSKDFYTPCIHIYVLLNTMYWGGMLVILIYSVELIEKVTQSENAAFTGGIIVNSTLFFCFNITCFLTRRFNNKSVYLASAIGTVICLLSASVVQYMQTVGFLPKDSLLCLYCLLAYMVCICLGMTDLAFSIAAELMPVKHRGLGGGFYVIFTCILHSSSLKLAPYLFLHINIWGTFLVYAVNIILCSLFVWKYVPETKGKTLQEIEDFYMYGKFIACRKTAERDAFVENNSK